MNHSAIRADCPTLRFSPPSPYSVRPSSITGMLRYTEPSANTSCIGERMVSGLVFSLRRIEASENW